MANAMSSVTITSDDFYLYTAFKSWLSKQKLMMLEKAITAQSVFYLRNKGQDGRTIEKELANNKSIVFDPQNKFQFFRYQGRFFLLTMDTKQMMHTSTDRTEMKIWCLGLSPQPIEKMLLEVYDASRSQDSRTLTTIMTPHGGRQWNRRCIKPARPLSSVYLKPEEKNRLLEDMKEYLAPTTAKWYQDRGIPYRRGYLFHGAPGCGKTSLAVSLAGHFKLDVYIVSLLDLEISDSALLQLFQAVRAGVLVLLEDVDSAGLGREVADDSSAPKQLASTLTNANGTIAETKKAKLQTSRITLSGLLNAIDGAGAPEGHILVMTTNTPDALDEALVRPGRIDVKVEFSKASRVQVRDIFANMYRPASSFDKIEEKKSVGGETVETDTEREERLQKEAKEKEEEEKLAWLAEQFAEGVPEKAFSPAELQDYILLRKDQPQRAVGEVEEWVAKQISRPPAEASRPETGKTKSKKKQKKAIVEQDDGTANNSDGAGVEADGKRMDKDDGKQIEQAKKTDVEGENNEVRSSALSSEPQSLSPASEDGSDSEKRSEEGDTPASSLGEDEKAEAEAASSTEDEKIRAFLDDIDNQEEQMAVVTHQQRTGT